LPFNDPESLVSLALSNPAIAAHRLAKEFVVDRRFAPQPAKALGEGCGRAAFSR
jgi:hypothetical protein